MTTTMDTTGVQGPLSSHSRGFRKIKFQPGAKKKKEKSRNDSPTKQQPIEEDDDQNHDQEEQDFIELSGGALDPSSSHSGRNRRRSSSKRRSRSKVSKIDKEKLKKEKKREKTEKKEKKKRDKESISRSRSRSPMSGIISSHNDEEEGSVGDILEACFGETTGSFKVKDSADFDEVDMIDGRTSTIQGVTVKSKKNRHANRTASNSPRRGRRQSKGRDNNESSSNNLLVRLARSMSPGNNKRKKELRAARSNNSASKRKQKKGGNTINPTLNHLSNSDKPANSILQNKFNHSEAEFLAGFDWDEDKELDDAQATALQKMVREFELLET